MKKTVALIFGGEGAERKISEISAANLNSYIDRQTYDVLPIGIAPGGEWYIYYGDCEKIGNGEWFSEKEALVPTFPVKLGEKSGFISGNELISVSSAIPCLHGNFGEDGVVQGALTLAHISYIGQDVYASAMTSDKVYTKLAAKHLGIPQADWILSTDKSADGARIRAEAELGYPLFIKPARMGSSFGAHPVLTKSEFLTAYTDAIRYDERILIERLVPFEYELECALLEVGEILVCPSGRVHSGGAFYDYEAKYCDTRSPRTSTEIRDWDFHGLEERISCYTRMLASLIGIKHLSRFDFFVTKNEEVYFNEINAFPGMTKTSLYPTLTENFGLGKGEFINRLIAEVC